MNGYIHGYVAIPIVLSLRIKGILSQLYNQASSLDMIADKFNANKWYLKIALRMLESLNWIKLNSLSCYKLTMQQSTYEAIQKIPKEIMNIYRLPIETTFTSKKNQLHITESIDRVLSTIDIFSKLTSNDEIQLLSNFLLGTVIIPNFLAISLDRRSTSAHNYELSILYKNLLPDLQKASSKLLLKANLLEKDQNTLDIAGQFLFDRALNTAVAASYAPMLYGLEEIIFGNFKKIFSTNQDGHELHIDRTLNVIASGFQHGNYFKKILNIIKPIFDKLPLSEQPKYIIDIGCGDGSLLKNIYDTILLRTARGKKLAKMPLYLIGADYNQKSLDATKKTLSDIPHITVKADINNPQALISDLENLSVNKNDCLHIRSFIDHDRPYIPTSKVKNDRANKISLNGIFIDKNGDLISDIDMFDDLVHHLTNWSSVISRHGLILLEVHSLNTNIISKYLNQSESFHFDLIQFFSSQYLVEADIFLIAAAKAGMFSKIEFFQGYPTIFPYTRITLNYFEKKPYTIECAQLKDIPELLKLKEMYLSKSANINSEELNNRILNNPQNQLILKINNKILGAVHTEHRPNIIDTIEIQLENDIDVTTSTDLQVLEIYSHPEIKEQDIKQELLKFLRILSLVKK